MIEHEPWKPELGTRVMHVIARRDYQSRGEIGVVVGYSGDGFDVEIEDEQIDYQLIYGEGAKEGGHGCLKHFSIGDESVVALHRVYRTAALRMQAVANELIWLSTVTSLRDEERCKGRCEK